MPKSDCYPTAGLPTCEYSAFHTRRFAPSQFPNGDAKPLIRYGNGGCSGFSPDSLLSRFHGTVKQFVIKLFALVNLAAKHADIGQISVILVIVKTVTHNEFVWNINAHIVSADIRNTPCGLVKKGYN